MLNTVSSDIQWLYALVVPLTKAINDRIIEKFITESALPENIVEAKFIGKISNNIAYSFWLAITLATSATEVTGHVLLGINFCINLGLCSRILRFGRKVSTLNLYIENEQSLKKHGEKMCALSKVDL